MQTADSSYPSPVSALLKRGETNLAFSQEWPDYVGEFGLTDAHVPALIQMALDPALHDLPADAPALYAPIHAWRSLGQLRAEAAAGPLVGMLHDSFEDDWVQTEVPRAIGLIGAAAVEPAIALLSDKAADVYARGGAAEALRFIAEGYPETRPAVIEALTHQLEGFEADDELFNAFIVEELAELSVESALPLIQRAFEAHKVDQYFIDWEEVQVRFGLLKERRTPFRFGPPPGSPHVDNRLLERENQLKHQDRAAKKAKDKRKAQKQARKAGRKK